MPSDILPGEASRHSIFIVSSSEALSIAEKFRDGLLGDARPTLWPDAFPPSNFTLEALESALDQHTHGLIVLSPDDITKSRGTEEISPRDNAIFEMGLFVGRHGHRSAFIAVPDTPKVRLPTDIWGLVLVEYKVTNGPAGVSYDVAPALKRVIESLKKEGVRSGRRAYEKPSPFWDVMADTILIIHGVESDGPAHTHLRHRVSLRDLGTSLEIKSFLDRHYPKKRVLFFPASTAGWEEQYTNADLVIVGGFVTNSEFAQHRSRYENLFRLRMGRLCIADGQRINVPKFRIPDGRPPPAAGDSQGIEDVPTEYTTRDYGFIFSGPLYMYGHERRVVAIAGVKGHGTRGAAAYLCREGAGVAGLLTTPLRFDDTFEAAVAVDVVKDLVDTVKPISARRGSEMLLDLTAPDSRACELGHPCEGCEFGLPAVVSPKPLRLVPSKIKAIVFDLDDTLMDTYSSLITALELRAAEVMIKAGTRQQDVMTVARALLQIRRITPFDERAGLRRSGFGFSKAALLKRKEVLEDAISIEHLVLSPDVAHLLSRLRIDYPLHLLTSGSTAFQNAKIDKLGIRSYFTDVVIVSKGSHLTKARALASLASDHRLGHESVLVVGNRLDQEIAAANSLGMPSVWIKCGEGCEMVPAKGRGDPDFTIENVLRLPALLWD